MEKSKTKKIIYSIIAVILAAVLVCVSIFFLYPIYKKNKTYTITVESTKRLGDFDGFGVSACWWSQIAGGSENAEEIAKLLYSKDGLGLNIYRYNIGAGEADNENSTIGNPWRKTESFYVWNDSSQSYEYDFTRDANAQKMLEIALSYGVVDTVVLFANSPHYSMTVSGKASGGNEEYVSNLPKENYEAYADYFLTITQYFLDKGVPVKYISPLNEPQWGWGGEYASQEGCHYEADEIHELLKIFAEKIQDKNMPVLIAAPESGAIGDETKEWFKTIYDDEVIAKSLGTLAYHSYWSDDFVDRKIDFGNWITENVPYAKIEMSEWCQLPCIADTKSIFGALTEARVIANDITLSGANSWSVWTGVNQAGIGEDGKDYSDGLISANDDCSSFDIALRYYAVAHFSKFVPAGSVVVPTVKDYDDTSTWNSANPEDHDLRNIYKTSTAAFFTPEGKMVLVIVNEGDEHNFKFNVDGAETMHVYTTTEEEQMKEIYSGRLKKIKLPRWSISTIVFD